MLIKSPILATDDIVPTYYCFLHKSIVIINLDKKTVSVRQYLAGELPAMLLVRIPGAVPQCIGDPEPLVNS